MDREEYDNTISERGRNTFWLRYGYASRKGISKANASWGDEDGPHPWMFKYTDFIALNTVQDGKIAKEFNEKDS